MVLSYRVKWKGTHGKTLFSRKVTALTIIMVLFLFIFLISAEDDYDYEYSTAHSQYQEEPYIDFSESSLDSEPEIAAEEVLKQIIPNLQSRIADVFQRAKTRECREKVAEHFGYFLKTIAEEKSLPFAEVEFENTCPEPIADFENPPEGMHIGDVQNRTYQPEDAEYIDNSSNLNLLYAILTHQHPEQTIRLIKSLYEPGHVFVIHVDGKENSDKTFDTLLAYSQGKDYVHIIPQAYRVRVNWGGFSMVNATMQMLRYAFATDTELNNVPLSFHKFIHMSSTSYPIASNTKIRNELSQYPLDSNHMNIVMKPVRPRASAWQYFVECDDWVHRIYRLNPINEHNGGIELYTSSQWFILSREFAAFIAEAEPGTLVPDLLEYMQHVVVADESFFGTLLRATKFCTKLNNNNRLHISFDRWENEEKGERDERKCIMADRDHCGRSPTILTTDYAANLELSGMLFARKFDDDADSDVKDYIDALREREEAELRGEKGERVREVTAFEGHGVLIVAKDTVKHEVPLCLGIGQSRNKARLVPCFEDWVPKTLAPNWETGAVILEETVLHTRWNIGPCSKDGSLERNTDTAELLMTPGNFSAIGPRCMITQADGIREGRCLDSENGVQETPGGTAQVYPCAKRWHQFFSFGNGNEAPQNSIHASIPRHQVHRLRDVGYPKQEYHLCLGVRGRGENDEPNWQPDPTMEEGEDLVPDLEGSEGQISPLYKWNGMQIAATRCSNIGAVIEWLYVPFIVEQDDSGENNGKDDNAKEPDLDKDYSDENNGEDDNAEPPEKEL